MSHRPFAASLQKTLGNFPIFPAQTRMIPSLHHPSVSRHLSHVVHNFLKSASPSRPLMDPASHHGHLCHLLICSFQMTDLSIPFNKTHINLPISSIFSHTLLARPPPFARVVVLSLPQKTKVFVSPFASDFCYFFHTRMFPQSSATLLVFLLTPTLLVFFLVHSRCDSICLYCSGCVLVRLSNIHRANVRRVKTLPQKQQESQNQALYRFRLREGLEVRTPKLLAALPTLNVRHVGLVITRVTSVFGFCHISMRLRLVTSTWVTNVDFLVHLHELAVQVLPFRSLDALADGLADCVPVLVPICRPPLWWR